MTEIIGKCLSVDDTSMIILDDDNDEIEMLHKHEFPQKTKILEHFRTLIGYRISYYYDGKGIQVKKINEDEQMVREFPSGNVRTLSSFSYI